MNWEMLRLAADHIENDPNAFDMEIFGFRRGCGAVGCVAGHIVWANDPHEFMGLIIDDEDGMNRIEPRAYELLGICDMKGYHLFYGGSFSLGVFNRNKAKVPDALRWMVDNQRIDWPAAAKAVGFE